MTDIISIRRNLKTALWCKAYDLYRKGLPVRNNLMTAAPAIIRDLLASDCSTGTGELLEVDSYLYIDEIILVMSRMETEHSVKSITAANALDSGLEHTGIKYCLKCGARWPEITMDAGRGVSVTLQMNYRRLMEQVPLLKDIAEGCILLVHTFGPDTKVTDVLPWIEWKQTGKSRDGQSRPL